MLLVDGSVTAVTLVSWTQGADSRCRLVLRRSTLLLRRLTLSGLVFTASGRLLVRLRHLEEDVVSGFALSAPVDLLVAGLMWSCRETSDLATAPLSRLMTVLDLVATWRLSIRDEGGVGGVIDEVESGKCELFVISLLDSGEDTVGLGTSWGSVCKY